MPHALSIVNYRSHKPCARRSFVVQGKKLKVDNKAKYGIVDNAQVEALTYQYTMAWQCPQIEWKQKEIGDIETNI